jgi:hypothetical protein
VLPERPASPASSGNHPAMSTPLRLRRLSPPPTTCPSARYPSHLGSNAHPAWSPGSSRAAVGCIGRNPAGGPTGPAAALDLPRTPIHG